MWPRRGRRPIKECPRHRHQKCTPQTPAMYFTDTSNVLHRHSTVCWSHLAQDFYLPPISDIQPIRFRDRKRDHVIHNLEKLTSKVKSDLRQAKYFPTKSPAVASSPASLRTKQFIRRGAGLLLQEGRGRGKIET